MPLDTLAGWPAAPDPTALQVLGLLVGIPALVVAAVFLLGKATSLAKAGRRSEVGYTNAVWLGASPRPAVAGSDEGSQLALEAGSPHDAATPGAGAPSADLAGTAALDGPSAARETGGARVRW